mmetsp:Transcript_5514/g.7042  ORF Transcript_5514/g.7042 Transcript_5514/m.7042 type:complete len:499 (+) Transcript_5514:124-1620(+)
MSSPPKKKLSLSLSSSKNLSYADAFCSNVKETQGKTSGPPDESRFTGGATTANLDEALLSTSNVGATVVSNTQAGSSVSSPPYKQRMAVSALYPIQLSKVDMPGFCICSWPECRDWTNVFKSTPRYESLGKISRIRHNVAKSDGFRNNLIHHIKPQNSQDLQNKDIHIAWHHFPHKIILDSSQSAPCFQVTKPISESTAKECNIGILPHYKTNIFCSKTKKYFLSPVVTRKEVEQLVKKLQRTELSSITSREVRRERRTKILTPIKKNTISNNVIPSKNNTISNNVTPQDIIVNRSEVEQSVKKSQTDISSVTREVCRERRNITISTPHKENMIISNVTPKDTGIHAVTDYIPTVEFLVGKLEAIVLPAFKTMDQNSSYKRDALNEMLSKNIHFTNICNLLADYHKCTAAITLNIYYDADKVRSMKLCFCSGRENGLCSKAFICSYVKDDPVCGICKLERRKNQRRKLKRKHESGDDGVQSDKSLVNNRSGKGYVEAI